MSTQLILFPQNYNGQYNYISNPTAAYTNFISNGQVFSGLGSATLYSTNSVKPPLDAILNEHPYIVNTWYRFTTIVGAPGNWGAVTAPYAALNNLVLSVGSAEGHTGVYQRLTGLIVGATYTVKISIVTGQIGTINLATYLPYSGIEQASYQFSSNTTSINWSFHATSTNQILSVDYMGDAANLIIESIAVLSLTTTPSGIFTDLVDGQVICDLYQEEDIPLTLSIDDFKNVAEKVQSYSKDFNLPATKRNNRIFNNMFEVTRADDGLIFNPYVKTKCVLKQDGFILFEGYLRLINVKDDNGEISYNVNLYSEVIALADTLKEKTFSDLDFSELEHDYTYANIRNSWQGILALTNPLPVGTFAGIAGASTTSVLKYPFIDWTHQYPQSNGNPVLLSMGSTFRPCIKLKYLIDNIFAASGFTYTSDFFNEVFFSKLYMDFNWGTDNAPVIFSAVGELYRVTGVGIPDTWLTLTYDPIIMPDEFGFSSGVFTAIENGQSYNIQYNMNFDFDLLGAELRVRWVVAGVIQNQVTVIVSAGCYLYTGSFTAILQAGETIRCEAIILQGNPLTGVEFHNPTAIAVLATTSVAQTTNETLLQTLRGELGQWDFLKGIMTMFNLVSMIDENNPDNILIEPYSDVFIKNTNSGTTSDLTLAARSIEHDWTEKVDVSQMELKPLTDLNKNTIFQFVEDDDDYVFGQYKNATSGSLYGAKYWDASGLTILQGTEEIIAEPFAATVSKPLMPEYTDFIVPTLYAMSDEGTTEAFDNSPRIFYNNGVKDLTSCTYFVPCENAASPCGDATEDEFLQFSHLSTVPTVVTIPPDPADTVDFVFSSHQLYQPIGLSPTNNLFNTYWLPYFAELYNADTRTMILKVNLSPADIASFKFYDTVFIKNRTFRVNKIQYKPNSLATVEFILIP